MVSALVKFVFLLVATYLQTNELNDTMIVTFDFFLFNSLHFDEYKFHQYYLVTTVFTCNCSLINRSRASKVMYGLNNSARTVRIALDND